MKEVKGVQEPQPQPDRAPKTAGPVRATEVPDQFCSFAGMEIMPEDEAGEISVYPTAPRD